MAKRPSVETHVIAPPHLPGAGTGVRAVLAFGSSESQGLVAGAVTFRRIDARAGSSLSAIDLRRAK